MINKWLRCKDERNYLPQPLELSETSLNVSFLMILVEALHPVIKRAIKSDVNGLRYLWVRIFISSRSLEPPNNQYISFTTEKDILIFTRAWNRKSRSSDKVYPRLNITVHGGKLIYMLTGKPMALNSSQKPFHRLHYVIPSSASTSLHLLHPITPSRSKSQFSSAENKSVFIGVSRSGFPRWRHSLIIWHEETQYFEIRLAGTSMTTHSSFLLLDPLNPSVIPQRLCRRISIRLYRWTKGTACWVYRS